LDLAADLASLALDRVLDERSELAAHHLAGYTDAYRHDPRSALAHLEAAERLAERLGDTWQLASVRQARGVALRSADDLDAAMVAFESAMHSFASAGDAMHVNNARYMMAATAAERGHPTEAALVWVDQCAEYARSTGNRHELAHAELTRARLTPDEPPDLTDAVATFRRVGDFRCLVRSYLLQAEQRPAPERAALYEQALEVAESAGDQLHKERALEGLIAARWEAGERRRAAVALGRLVSLLGHGPAVARCPEAMRSELDDWTAAIAEGQARSVPS
ncbi:MAG TPA: hypothetical protein VFV76_06365, partial [Actinomycetes bacterium]|nr:hypothetical protein [Actinomycetes bacterium]